MIAAHRSDGEITFDSAVLAHHRGSTLTPADAQPPAHEVRDVLRDSGCRCRGPGRGARGVPEHDRAGEARRPHGLPLLLDRRAPLPRRVLALLEPRGAVRPHRRRSPRISASATASACCPKPYNHPVRTAESVATLDLVSNGRVEFGTGRSSTRAEIEGFGIDPHETREMWDEALAPHRRMLDERRVRV